MELKIPESWDDCGMNWDDPDPVNPYYYMAIVEACIERACLYGSSLASVQDTYRSRIFKYFIPSRVIDIRSVLDALTYCLETCDDYPTPIGNTLGGYSNTSEFFVNKKITRASSDVPERVYPSCGSYLDNYYLKLLLKAMYNYINELTLFSSYTKFITAYSVQGYGESDVPNPNEPYSKLKSEASSIFAESFNKSIVDVVNTHNTSPGAWFGAFSRLYAKGEKYIRRENNGVYHHSHFHIEEECPFILVRQDFPYTAKLHAISTVTDYSVDEVNEYGVRTKVDNAVTRWGGVGTNLILDVIPSVSAGEQYLLTDIPNRPSDYPDRDVTTPQQTPGWEIYAQKTYAEIEFVLDLNCEGGFKFRPDDDSSKPK